MRVSVANNCHAVDATSANVSQLMKLAANWLVPMFDFDTQLFCFRMKLGPAGMIREGVSQRYTIMTLLGLHRYEAAGGQSPIDVRPAIDALIQQHSWIDSVGDIGLMLWMVAVAAPDRLKEIYSALQVDTVLTRYSQGREVRTMELAWLLTGLANAARTRQSGLVSLHELSMKTYVLLRRNQGESGLFGHQAIWKSLTGLVRGRIGTFADQVYPIYAFSLFAEAFGDREAVDWASKCAEAICRSQGPLGQWWWHYDALNGKVFRRYPVYSVHQDGMAPMALFALSDVADIDFSESIYSGLEWIYGNNELNIDFRDMSSGVIWRNIHQRGGRLVRESRNYISPAAADLPKNLEQLQECRPYELGWLLYAFAGR